MELCCLFRSRICLCHYLITDDLIIDGRCTYILTLSRSHLHNHVATDNWHNGDPVCAQILLLVSYFSDDVVSSMRSIANF